MRARAAALLLALLAAGAAGAAQGQAPSGQSLALVQAPAYAPGDFWAYRILLPGVSNASVTITERDEVLEVGTYAGEPAVRMLYQIVEEEPPQPGGFPLERRVLTNRTAWLSARGLMILRVDEVKETWLLGPGFQHLTRETTNETFLEPMDLYQFPICGPCRDAWVVVRNASVERNVTYVAYSGNGTTEAYEDPENRSVHETSAAQWLRDDRVATPAGTFDVVVLQGGGGGTTIFDSWAPLAGNLVRREFVNATGRIFQVVELEAYRFANAPASPAAAPGGLEAMGPLLGAGLAVALGLAGLVGLVGLVGLAWWARRRRARGGA